MRGTRLLRQHAQVFDVGDDGHGWSPQLRRGRRSVRGGDQSAWQRSAVSAATPSASVAQRPSVWQRCRRGAHGRSRAPHQRAGAHAQQAEAACQVDALQALARGAGGSPARRPSACGQREVARDGLEVVEAQLDADRACRRSPCAAGRAASCCSQLGEHARRARRGRAPRAGRGRRWSRGSSTPARCRVDHGAVVAAVRGLVQPAAVAAAEVLDQPAALARRQLADACGCPAPASLAPAFGPMPLMRRTGSGQMRVGRSSAREQRSGRRACRARRRSWTAACSA